MSALHDGSGTLRPGSTDLRLVRWCREYSTGARSWAAHGVTKIHTVTADRPAVTLCGVAVEHRPSMRLDPSGREVEENPEERCKRCERAARAAP